MKRREFITLLGGAVASWSVAVQAQQPERIRRLAWLLAFPERSPLARAMVAAVPQALQRLGWAEGRNIRIDYRFAAGDPALFKSYAAQLVALSPDAGRKHYACGVRRARSNPHDTDCLRPRTRPHRSGLRSELPAARG
jgi:hypothetical protein